MGAAVSNASGELNLNETTVKITAADIAALPKSTISIAIRNVQYDYKYLYYFNYYYFP